MTVAYNTARAAALAIACLTLGACATTLPTPERPGQMGHLTTDGKKTMGVMVAVHAPAADHCTYDGKMSWRKREGGYHDFLFVTGAMSNPAEVKIDCQTVDGQPLDRTLKAPFNEDAFRLGRTASTIGAVLGGGPLGLISGPLAAEMTKNTYRQPPVLIHVPSKEELATEEARAVAREAAVGRWRELGAMLDKACDAKTRTDKKVLIAYACPKAFFSVLRDTDLSVYSIAFTPLPQAPAAVVAEPAVAETPAEAAPVAQASAP